MNIKPVVIRPNPSRNNSFISVNYTLGNIDIIVNFVFPYVQFLSIFAPFDVSKCKITCKLLQEDKIASFRILFH